MGTIILGPLFLNFLDLPLSRQLELFRRDLLINAELYVRYQSEATALEEKLKETEENFTR